MTPPEGPPDYEDVFVSDQEWDAPLESIKQCASAVCEAVNSGDPTIRLRGKLRALQLAIDYLQTTLGGRPVEDVLAALNVLQSDMAYLQRPQL